MAFNYNVGGLNADIAGAALAGSRYRYYQQETKEREKEARRAREFRELAKQVNVRLAADANADVTDLYREMALRDREETQAFQEMNKDFDIGRQRVFFDTLKEADMYERMNRPELAARIFQERKGILADNQISTKHTDLVSSLYAAGEDGQLMTTQDQRQKALDQLIQHGEQMGIIEPPDAARREGTFIDDEGKEYNLFQGTDGRFFRKYTGDSREAELEQIRKEAADRGIKLNQDQAQRTLDLKNRIDENRSKASEAEELATELGRINAEGSWSDKGAAATVKDTIDKLFGTEDVNTFVRTATGGYFNKEVVRNRPPGAMSNFEFKTIRAGFPNAQANPELLEQYFREAGQAANLAAGLDRIEGNFIERSGSMFTTNRNFTVTADGITVDVKAGDTLEQVQNKWLDAANEREGERREKERERNVDKPRTARDFENEYNI